MEFEPVDQWARAVQDALYERATKIADRFWEKHYQTMEQPDRKQWGVYGIRVSKRNAGVTIVWVELVFRGGKGRRLISMKTIPRGVGDRYSMRCFPLAKRWERELIPEIEKELQHIRMLSTTLANGMATLRRFEHMRKELPTIEREVALATTIANAGKSIEQQMLDEMFGPLDDGTDPKPTVNKPAGKPGRGGLASSRKRVE